MKNKLKMEVSDHRTMGKQKINSKAFAIPILHDCYLINHYIKPDTNALEFFACPFVL